MSKIAIITGASSGLGVEYYKSIQNEALDEIWIIARRENRLNEIAEQLGKIKTYEIRPILEYKLEEERLVFYNKPSSRCYEKAERYMSGEQYREFVAFFDELAERVARV